MADETIFETLQEGSYDGIVIPVQSIRLSTGTRQVFHEYVFRPGADIEPTGREPVTGMLTATYVNDLEDVGGTNDLWPGALTLLRSRAQEQKAGPLVIPTLGTLPFAFIHVEENYTEGLVDGATVTISFAEDSSAQFSNLGVKSARSNLSAAAEKADAAVPSSALASALSGLDDNGSGSMSFANAVANVLGQLEQAQDSIARPIRQLQQIAQAVDDVIGAVSSLMSPSSWEAFEALRDLKSTALAAADEVSRAQDLRSYRTPVTTNIAAIAMATKNTIDELLAINVFEDANDIDANTSLLVFVR